jgi:hypothetical protein
MFRITVQWRELDLLGITTHVPDIQRPPLPLSWGLRSLPERALDSIKIVRSNSNKLPHPTQILM